MSTFTLLCSRNFRRVSGASYCVLRTTRKSFCSASSSSSSSTTAAAATTTTDCRRPLRKPNEKDINAFRSMMKQHPGSSVLTEWDDIESYNTDWTKHYQGTSSIVLRPQSTQEVSSILKYCHENFIGVVPQAGNTGLVGGGIPLKKKDEGEDEEEEDNSGNGSSGSSNEVILSVERMNRILSWNPTTGIITGEAGGILQDWQDYAQENCNVIIPVDLGSKGSCCIGGTVSTNAGGQYYARYKSLHANVVGLEVVLASGQILQLNLKEATTTTTTTTTDDSSSSSSNSNTDNDNNKNNSVLCNLKDNTGYDMKHLFIGAEGTLGIVTKVALWCSSSFPTSRCAVLCGCTSLEQVQQCLKLARKVLGETLAAFEFMDNAVVQLVASSNNNKINMNTSSSQMIPRQQQQQQQQQQHASSTEPLVGNDDNDDNDASSFFPYYILVETHGINSQHDEEKMQTFLEQSLEEEVVLDGVLAQDLTQVHALWQIRESCNPCVAAHGYTYKYDVSLPMSEFATFAQDMRQRLVAVAGDGIVTTNWGHIMDGNLHFNVTTPGKFHVEPTVLETLEPYIFESVVRRGGSISAEHGLGQSKHKYLPMVHDPATLALMKSIKDLLDPHGIMNPGKYLPPPE